jgi:hypothetical protein
MAHILKDTFYLEDTLYRKGALMRVYTHHKRIIIAGNCEQISQKGWETAAVQFCIENLAVLQK